jgi:hypothetical protein
MGFQVVLMFTDSFMDNFTYVRNVEACTYSMICYIPECICYGSENLGLGSLHADSIELAGTNAARHNV